MLCVKAARWNLFHQAEHTWVCVRMRVGGARVLLMAVPLVDTISTASCHVAGSPAGAGREGAW